MSELCLRHLVVAVVAACLLNGCEQPQAQAKVVIQTQPVKATGELVAATSFKASPPSVSQLWQYNIKELAPESSLLKAGDEGPTGF
jgi:HlyD family secretion protein